MSSIFIVNADLEDGFYVTEEDARRRVDELASQAGGGQRGGYSSIVEIEDTKYEIHRGGSVPDSVWLLLEEGEICDDWGYSVTRASAREDLEAWDITGFENWEISQEREQGMRLAEYLQECWGPYEIVQVQRHDIKGEQGQPSVGAIRAKNLIRHDTDLPEPTTSVRGELTTYTWEVGEEVVVEVRINGETWESAIAHKPDARPMVWSHSEDVIRAARGQLGVDPRVDLRLYLGSDQTWISDVADLDV
ncbi:hypothetical protein [Janibacter cremeus]|uniref:Uncharacterized protein n=1 Tax=Janibacter cremeus TaxID=1285192 RepID=A0A852VMP0_9MICO|nr:hypothetical protein [Janibacter cremeus]NYF96898.1 hypothetical protein [Janibacter cremeus]